MTLARTGAVAGAREASTPAATGAPRTLRQRARWWVPRTWPWCEETWQMGENLRRAGTDDVEEPAGPTTLRTNPSTPTTVRRVVTLAMTSAKPARMAKVPSEVCAASPRRDPDCSFWSRASPTRRALVRAFEGVAAPRLIEPRQPAREHHRPRLVLVRGPGCSLCSSSALHGGGKCQRSQGWCAWSVQRPCPQRQASADAAQVWAHPKHAPMHSACSSRSTPGTSFG